MKKHFTLILTAAVSAAALSAQFINVKQGNTTYTFSASDTEAATFENGETISIQGKTFNISDITNIKVSTEESIEDNTVLVVYDNDQANVQVAGNIAQYIDCTVTGADVVITQSDEVSDDTCGEITYTLSGESQDGSFSMTGAYKASIELTGLTLTSTKGAAIDIQDGKRIAMRVAEGTTNTLADASEGKQKGCIVCKGHLEFKQKGTLNVTGNTSHAIYSKEYVAIKNTQINILGSVKDGINCAQYFAMESGKLNIESSGDDGIQVSYKDDVDREAEDTGSINITGGDIAINISTDAAKALKCEGDFTMSKGSITATTTGGGIWDSSKLKTKASSCIGVDGDLDISGGTFSLLSTGGGAKGISVDGDLHISGGDFTITTTGGLLAYVNGVVNNNYSGNADNLNSDYKSSPKGIKVDGDIVIDGGEFQIDTKGKNGEGIESKKTLTINGGKIAINAYDDGTNSSSHTYINGGELTITTGVGDAIDSNGAIYISGGYLTVIGAGGSEQGFDAGDNYTIYFTGGTMLAAGGGNSAPTTSQSTQAYVTLTQAVAAGSEVKLLDGDTVLASFIIPAAYGTSTAGVIAKAKPGGQGGGWDWGWGGSTGSALLISTPDMVNGKTYTIQAGDTTTTSVAKTTGGSTGPGGR